MKLIIFTTLILSAISVISAEKIILEETLQTNSTLFGTLYGGSFSAEGYKPGLGRGHIFYELPETVENGYAEFEFKGMNHEQVASGGEPAFFCMYDGRGISEPIGYFDDFKRNFFRYNVLYRQDNRKIKGVINCAEPTQERLEAEKAVFPSNNRDWVGEPDGETMTWNSAKWHKMRVEWKNIEFKIYIDGIEKWAQYGGPYEYAPVIHRIWLGCAPGYGDKYNNQTPDIVYRNFKLVSYDNDVEGLMTKIEKDPVKTENINLEIKPNPFNPSAVISLSGITSSASPALKIYDSRGRMVNAGNGYHLHKSAGGFRYEWDASEMPAGVYTAVMETSSSTEPESGVSLKKRLIKKMILIK
ncbi:MAG: hypothetical protein ACLFQK_06905 [Fibrobacterota bacterium]